MNGKITKIVMATLAAAGLIFAASWKLDSRIEAHVAREVKDIKKDVERMRAIEATVIRIEERVKALDKKVENKCK